jgi:hypothetical protein
MDIIIPDCKIANYVTEMATIANESWKDTEVSHINADRLLCDILKEIGLSQVVEEFERCEKWYA